MLFDDLHKFSAGSLQSLIQSLLRITLHVVVQFDDCLIEFLSLVQLLNNLLNFRSGRYSLACDWLARSSSTKRRQYLSTSGISCRCIHIGIKVLLRLIRTTRLRLLQNNADPFLDVRIGHWVLLDHPVIFPDSFALELDQFVQYSLDNSDTEVVVLSFVIVVDDGEIFVHDEDYLFSFQLSWHFFHDLGQFEQAFDDEAGEFGKGFVVSVLLEQFEQDAENVIWIAIVKQPEHGGVEIFDN